MKLILIRHAACAGMSERRFGAPMINDGLSESGRKLLLDRKSRGVYPHADLLYVSPMRGCVETGHLLYPMLVPVTLSSLMERDYGIFQGKTYEELNSDPAYRRWIESGRLSAPPGGESHQEFVQRIHGAVLRLAQDAQSRNILTAAVVTHSSSILEMLRQFYNPQLDETDVHLGEGGGYVAQLEPQSLHLSKIQPI